ncbi:CopG family transcriptional regulator [Pseudomonas aeruginosa]|nr:CopG family transcriptional regulator [Pseudomonas aeruginosa]
MSEVMAPKDTDTAARRRGKPIEVWVTDEEKAAITELADQTGLSRSAYLRAVGLNRPVGARADLEAVRELVRLNGDLGRVAGLLKLWLAEKRGQGAKPIDVERMMIDFRELQAGIREQMSAIVFTRK